MNILVAEDEVDIRSLIKLNLEQEGYSVYTVSNGIAALELIEKESVDLAVLDVMMPRLDGFNLLRKIREFSTIPVIFLTARGDEMDKILGLGLGADDYLVKPFAMGELIARIGAQLRRSLKYHAEKKETCIQFTYGDLVLDTKGCCLYKKGLSIELNAKEYLLLKHFMENPGRVFTKKQLYRAVWDEEAYFDDNTIMVHISHLRTKIEPDQKHPTYIRTIRGIGYKFQLPTEGDV